MPRCPFARPSGLACSMCLLCSGQPDPASYHHLVPAGSVGGEFASRPGGGQPAAERHVQAGVVTLVQLFSIGPVGGQNLIIMGTRPALWA